MVKNVSKSIMLLLTFAFFLGNCSGLRKADSPYRTTSNTPKKTNTRKKSVTTKESSIRKNVVSQALKCKGTKYKYGGRSLKGFDCSGLTTYVMKKVNIDISGSSRTQSKKGKKVAISKAKPGDLVFFSHRKGQVNHVAIVVKNGKSGLEVIHSTSSKGVVIQNVSRSNYWKPRMLFARDIIGK